MRADRTEDRVGRFRNAAAGEKWLAEYDEAIGRWPEPGEPLDVPTRFGTTRVYRYGPATGTPIVLLTGIGGSALGWVYSVGPLSRTHPVYSVDPIGGAGHSVQTAPLDGVDDLVTWLVDLLDGLDTPAAHLVGFSYGGWYAAHAAARRPERVATLTLLDPAGLAPIGIRHYWWGIRMGLGIVGPRALRPWWARRLHSPSLLRVDDVLVGLKGAQLYRDRLPKMRPFTDDELRAIAVPTLLLLGERSSIHHARVAGQRVATLTPAATVELVPGVGHSLPMDVPDLVNERIVAFVSAPARREG
jgi:pimeloyl-ACP methyl ester carboxylesterase